MPLSRVAGNVPAMKKAPPPVRSPLPRSAGFTILELMIAVAVLAIIVGIGVPAFTDIIRRNRLSSQTNGLMGALAIARSEAVKRGTPVTICPASDANQDVCAGNVQWAANGWIVFADGEGTLGMIDADATEPNDTIIQRMPAASAQKVNVINADRTFLTYRPDGGVDLPAGTLTLFRLVPEGCVNPLGAREVEVIAAGRASSRRINCP